jgi:hypothetical protein
MLHAYGCVFGGDMAKEPLVLGELSTRFRRAEKVLQNDLAITKSLRGG